MRELDQTDALFVGNSICSFRFPVSAQQPGCYRICNKRTNHGQKRGANAERPNNLPALVKQLAVIVATQGMRILQQGDPFFGNSDWPAEEKCANRIRRHDDRNQRQKRIINEGATVNGDLIEPEDECDKGGENCVKAQEGAEGDKNADSKCKRRSLRRIIQREQTAEGRTKHL